MIRDLINNKLLVRDMGLIEALWLIILSIALEVFVIIIPQLIGEFIFVQESNSMIFGIYNFAVGVIAKFVVLYVLIKIYTTEREPIKNYIDAMDDKKHMDGFGFVDESKPSTKLSSKEEMRVRRLMRFEYRVLSKEQVKSLYLPLALMVVLFRMFYDNSLAYLVEWAFPLQQWLIDAFDNMTVIPVLGIISIVFVAPITEEILFRGLLLKGMLKRVNFKFAIFTSAMLFALIHFNFAQGINAFFLGIMVSVVYYYTNSLKLAIYIHFINNGFVLTFGALSEVIHEFLPETIQYGIGIGFLFVFIYYLNVVIRRRIKDIDGDIIA
jgi:membrane protease YdiL (CAAX protease family)